MKGLSTILIILQTLQLFGQENKLTDNQTIRIICTTSITENPVTYFIINGDDDKQTEIPIDSFGTENNALTLIDPKWIKDIKIYKGKKAVDLYGDVGKNGIVVIKLKKGRYQEFLKKVDN